MREEHIEVEGGRLEYDAAGDQWHLRREGRRTRIPAARALALLAAAAALLPGAAFALSADASYSAPVPT